MRSEWVPVSAAALVTGVMSLVLGQMLNPAGSEASPARQMIIAGENPERWLAMSILYFGGAAALVLGMPAVMTLFQDRKGRGLGMTGVALFTIGCVGVGGLAAMMLMFRALALETLEPGGLDNNEILLVTESLQRQGVTVPLLIWVWGFVVGVLLIAMGLLRAKRVPGWVPGLLLGFIGMYIVAQLLGGGTDSRIVSALGMLLLAAGLTGIATSAASPQSTVPVTHTLVRG